MNGRFPLEPDSDLVLDHIRSPYHKGHLGQPTCSRAERNPLCGDQLQMDLQIEEGRIQQAYFDGCGCAISQAAASILCEYIEGKTIAALMSLRDRDMLDLLKVPLSPVREQCGLLAFRALTALLARECSNAHRD